MAMRKQRSLSVERTITASPEAIFAILADPAQHSAIDGSHTLLSDDGAAKQPSLALGSVFVTPMTRWPQSLHRADLMQAAIATARGGRMRNTVIEFVQNRRIAWCNFGNHIWRYELEPADDGTQTQVTETFDYRPNPAPWLLEIAGFPERNAAAMTTTLHRLDRLCADQAQPPDAGRPT